LGTFDLLSGKASVQDPGYGRDSDLAVNLTVAPGSWRAWITMSDQKEWGERVSSLIVAHEGSSVAAGHHWESVGVVAVDSGQAGVFAPEHIGDATIVPAGYPWKRPQIAPEDPWYSLVCDQTLGTHEAGVVPYGVASSSGLGDGGYEVGVAKIGRVIAGIRITYLE
jgi:hypothetical protein